MPVTRRMKASLGNATAGGSIFAPGISSACTGRVAESNVSAAMPPHTNVRKTIVAPPGAANADEIACKTPVIECRSAYPRRGRIARKRLPFQKFNAEIGLAVPCHAQQTVRYCTVVVRPNEILAVEEKTMYDMKNLTK